MPANERQCTIPLLQEEGGKKKKKSLANAARLARLAANQIPNKTLPVSVSLSSPLLLLIPSCSNCFCYACSGKIAVSFVSSSQLDKAVDEKRKKRKSNRERLSLPYNWRQDVVIQVQFHHPIFYCVSRAAPLFIITRHCVISNSFFQHKQKWFCSTQCSLVAMMSLAMTKSLLFCVPQKKNFFLFIYFLFPFRPSTL